MKLIHALGAGLAASASLSLIHELTRRVVPEAPRMDEVGMRAIARTLRKVDQPVPPRKKLFEITLIADLISNALYYSLVGVGKDSQQVWLRGGILGLLAGVGAAVLPSSMGLGDEPVGRTPLTRIMTVLYYTYAGFAAAAVYRLLHKPSQPELTRMSDFLGE